MSMDKIDLAALDRDLQDYARQQQKRGWWRRNWRRLVLIVLLVLVGLAGGAYWWLIWRVHHLEVYQMAMQVIRADKDLQKQLGEPMHSVKWPLRKAVPSAQIDDREINILWAIYGPKARADVRVHAKLMMGKWEIDVLEVTPAGGKKLQLNVPGDNEAKPFSGGPKPDEKKSEPNAPAPDINMPVPPGEPGK